MGIFDSFLEKKYGKETIKPNRMFWSDENGDLKEIPPLDPVKIVPINNSNLLVSVDNNEEKINKLNRKIKILKRNNWRKASKRRR